MRPRGPLTRDEKRQLAVRLVAEIEADLTDRRGLRQAWEEIDEGTRQEIRREWRRCARERGKAEAKKLEKLHGPSRQLS